MDNVMEDFEKSSKIRFYLFRLGYTFTDELDAVRVIKENHIDMSAFDFPYGAKNPEEWEQKLLERKELLRQIENRELSIDPNMTLYSRRPE